MTQDLEAAASELRELAQEIIEHHSLMLALDLNPEDAPGHRAAIDQAREALEDVALAERRRAATPGPPVAAAQPSPQTLWAEWQNVCFLSRKSLSPKMKSSIIRRYGIKNYARLPE